MPLPLPLRQASRGVSRSSVLFKALRRSLSLLLLGLFRLAAASISVAGRGAESPCRLT